jgi:penicillin amidase
VKILKIAIIALLSLLLFAAMVVYFFFRSTIPPWDGVLPGCGVAREVIIERSPHGVPTIKADSAADLFFAVGFAHAQDRLFQMDLQRRAASGRLAEVLGEQGLERDIGQHYLQAASGIEKSVRALTREVRNLLEHYCRGVNCALASQALPPEFHVLRYSPEAWQVRDVLATMKFLEGELASSGGELNHARLLAALDTGRSRDWLAVPRGDFDNRRSFWSRALSIPPLPRLLAAEVAGEGFDPSGSAWAVAGSRTVSGRPILVNDFSWPLRLPALFYQVAGRTPAMEISGNTIPGVPFIFSGRNRHLSWGVSPDRSDTLDYFLLERHPGNARLYRCEGRWRELEYRDEWIRCRGRGPYRLRLAVSRFGPVIEAADGLLAVRSLVQYRSHAMEALFLMNVAHGPKDLAMAMRKFSAPALRVVFADRKGNIGVARAGMEPRRGKGDGLLPQRVLAPGDAWTGFSFTAAEQVVLNPDKGWVSAGDLLPLGPAPRFFTFAAPPGLRARRLAQLLAASSGLDPEATARLQNDALVPEADYLVGLIRDMPLVSEEAKQVRGILSVWDLNAGDGAGPSYFYEFEKLLAAAVFSPALRDGAAMAGIFPGWLYGALRAPGLLKRQALVAAVDESLAAAHQAFRRRSRNQDDGWNWEVQHTAGFHHPLGEIFFLRPLFERGPLAVCGGNACLLDTGFEPRTGFKATRLAAYKMIQDLSTPAASLLVYPGGQSGHPLSPAYDDQLGAFVSQKYFKMEDPGRRIHRLRLLPGTEPGTRH